MSRSFATALALGLGLAASAPPSGAAFAQFPPAPAPSQCNDFGKLRQTAQDRATALRQAGTRKADPKEMCTLVTRFSAAETVVVKFLEDNKTWCGIPDTAVTQAKANHEQTVKFQTMICSAAEAPKPKAPTLSDAINLPSVDSSKNTKTGRGTFDTLTGNPLAK